MNLVDFVKKKKKFIKFLKLHNYKMNHLKNTIHVINRSGPTWLREGARAPNNF